MKMHAYPQVNVLDGFVRRKKTFIVPRSGSKLPKLVIVIAFVGSNQLPVQSMVRQRV